MITKPVSPLNIGIVGTGYAAKKRAEAIKASPRTELFAVTGRTASKLQEFCQTYSATAVDSAAELVNLAGLDLILVCTTNESCDAIAKMAIEAGKHVVVEYPVSLSAKVAEELIELAQARQKLLHVEHIEIIGGLHQSLKQYLPQVGKVFHAAYTTIAPQHPVNKSWKYHRTQFGFPLSAALSRVHRLTDLFGKVSSITCRDRYWDAADADYFTACFCQARLNFSNGVSADLTYGKGDVFWQGKRTLEIWGEQGKIIFEGQKGTLIQGDRQIEIPVTPRKGLFAQDTEMVLDYLYYQQPLYIQPQASLYALKVANAAQQAALSQSIVYLD